MSTSDVQSCVVPSSRGMKSLAQLMDLRGRVAVVTGGAGHIGAVICEALAELGANIAVLDRTAEACTETVARIRDSWQVEATPMVIDLADESDVRSVCSRVVEEFGRLDILVNCAAYVGVSNLPGWATSFDPSTPAISPRCPSINRLAANAPNLKARMRSKAVGDPPLCMCPKTRFRASNPVFF